MIEVRKISNAQLNGFRVSSALLDEVVDADFERQPEEELAEARGGLRTGGAKMIEVRKISDTPILGISLFVVFYNGVCKPVYARNGKEAEEKVRTIVEKEGYNMSNYAECPYCGEKQEIDNDGYSYNVGTIHRQKCAGCGKNFAYVTTVSIFHEAFVAPCIDGDAEHDWKETKTFPRCYRKLRCSVCGEEKEIEGVEEERKAHLAELRKRTGARA